MRRTAAVVLGLMLIAAVAPGPANGARLGGGSPRTSNPAVAPNPDGVPPGMQTVIVTMRSQADLAAVPGQGRPLGRQDVVRALRAHAADSQRALLRYLDREAAHGRVAAVVPFWVFDGLSVTASDEVVAAIAARGDVASVQDNDAQIVPLAQVGNSGVRAGASPATSATVTATGIAWPLDTPGGAPEANVGATGAPAMWDAGFTGQGIVVASLDSGVDVGHPDLGPRWRGGTNSWFDPYGQHPTLPADMTGHGTATMGVIVGGDAGGTAIGMAPGATWIAARIWSNSGTATTTAVHQAFQWILDPDGDPATDDAPDVLSNSWSFGGVGCNLEFQLDIHAARAAGILPVFAGGNSGPGGSTSVSPANNPEALAVGSVDAADVIDPRSSRGPSGCGEPPSTYPEVVAPGVDIRSADRYGLYQVLSGSSVAAPHVAGALALLLDAHPGTDVDWQAAALAGGAVDLGSTGTDNSYGAGRINVHAAHAWLTANPPPTPAVPPVVASIAPSSGPTVGGTAVTITGTGFDPAPSQTMVTFGSAPAASVTCAATTTCTAVSPPAAAGSVDVRVMVGSQVSAVTPADAFTYTASATTTTVVVPAMSKGYGHWVTVTTTARGAVEATWTTPTTIQRTLAIYAGSPFAGAADPVKRNPPSGALATRSGKLSTLSVTTGSLPPGMYTVYFYAGSAVAASAGTVTGWR